MLWEVEMEADTRDLESRITHPAQPGRGLWRGIEDLAGVERICVVFGPAEGSRPELGRVPMIVEVRHLDRAWPVRVALARYA